VKLLAVPRPPPGPWDAKASPAHSKLPTVDAATSVHCDIPDIFRNDVMTISCDGSVAEDTDDSLGRF
jgi:hypothetical protein